MLKELQIANLVLIENAKISFSEGLNVLSGETGSGKSAIISALNLVMGERTDTGMIRRGAEKGFVEALFQIDKMPQLATLLEEAGINHDLNDYLIVRREISTAGKSRSFINHQSVQISFLKKIGEFLADMVGQHANQRLLSIDKHREFLDIFGGIEESAKNFSRSWDLEINLNKRLQDLLNSESQRLREIETCRMELEELEEAKLKDGEDDELFSEYSLLSHSEELAQKIAEVNQTLSGDRQPLLPLLNKLKAPLSQAKAIDASLEEIAKSYENALLELQEVAYSLRNYQSKIEYNPQKIADINERLMLITRLKRKYGATIQQIKNYEIESLKKLAQLENADLQIEEIRSQLKNLESQNQQLASELTEKRKQAAKILEEKMVMQLRALNMPKVEFYVEIERQKRGYNGDDRIEFFLIPNVGEHKISIKDCASGGELSRLMLSMQALLAGKASIPTLIFDEIDANIGGETAAIVGEKLKEIGRQHQVLCITHFPQVASKAQHHLQISKIEKEGRTITVVKVLEDKERQQELSRMLGKSKKMAERPS